MIGQLGVTQAMLPPLLHPAVRRSAGCDQGRVAALGDTLRQELAPWGIRVVLIEPASINSGAAYKVSRDAGPPHCVPDELPAARPRFLAS